MSAGNAGVYVYGDKESTILAHHVKGNGGDYDFTGCGTIQLVVESIDGSVQFTISGSIYSVATAGWLKFPAVAMGSTSPDPGPERIARYVARSRWKRSGETDFSYGRSDITFGVQRFPR